MIDSLFTTFKSMVKNGFSEARNRIAHRRPHSPCSKKFLRCFLRRRVSVLVDGRRSMDMPTDTRVRFVTFARVPQVAEIDKTNQEDRNALQYSEADIRQFRADLSKEVARIRATGRAEESNEKTMTGLEGLVQKEDATHDAFSEFVSILVRFIR